MSNLSFDQMLEIALDNMPAMFAPMVKPMIGMLSVEQKQTLEAQLNTAMTALERGDKEQLQAVLDEYPMLNQLATMAGYDIESIVQTWLTRASNHD